MAVLSDGIVGTITAHAPARIMVLGGAPLDGPRYLWWNFVSGNKDCIEKAKTDWAAGRFPAIPDDDDAMPLPG